MDLTALRAAYREAIGDAEAARQLYEHLHTYQGEAGIVHAYLASAQALMARHDWNPYQKLRLVRASMSTFRHAVSLDPLNPEIRFLRFAIQHYLPDFLDENHDLAADKTILLGQLPHAARYGLGPEEVAVFRAFLVESRRLTPSEHEQIRHLPPQP
ncbi:MAG: hypothetical protein SF053_16195 [Bacteroidia bacterium]|nr:hypothetical protein [Bacteroidia bacterium]